MLLNFVISNFDLHLEPYKNTSTNNNDNNYNNLF